MTRPPMPAARLALSAGLLLCLSSFASGQQPAPPPPQVTVVELQAKDVPLTYQYAARVSAHREVQVRARVGGILLKRHFAEGSAVTAGQVLFEIDHRPMQAAVEQSQAAVRRDEAQLAQARAQEERLRSLVESP